MKIICRHGHFAFEESRAGEASDLVSYFGLDLERDGDVFTFPLLVDAPRFALAGLPYLGAAVTKTFEGNPWDIMRENNLIYNFQTGLLVPILSVTQVFSVSQAGKYFVSPGLILPGSVTEDGERVMDYAAWYSFDTQKFKYSELTYV